MSALEDVERRTDWLYGAGSAVSVDQADKGWVVRCWDRKGIEKDVTPKPLPKAEAVRSMKRRLERACFLRMQEDADE